MRLIRQVWESKIDITTRLARLCALAEEEELGDANADWFAVVNEKALHYTGDYYAIFKVRDGLFFKVVTMFSS